MHTDFHEQKISAFIIYAMDYNEKNLLKINKDIIEHHLSSYKLTRVMYMVVQFQ